MFDLVLNEVSSNLACKTLLPMQEVMDIMENQLYWLYWLKNVLLTILESYDLQKTLKACNENIDTKLKTTAKHLTAAW